MTCEQWKASQEDLNQDVMPDLQSLMKKGPVLLNLGQEEKPVP